jgi:hypothetical protein
MSEAGEKESKNETKEHLKQKIYKERSVELYMHERTRTYIHTHYTHIYTHI